MVRYDNVRTSDSRELHETLRGEAPSIHLHVKERERIHELRPLDENNNNQTSRIHRSHGKAVGLIAFSILYGWHYKDF